MTIEELVKLRKENKIKQQDIAEVAGYTIPYVCCVEKGKYPLLKRFEMAYIRAVETIKNERK